MPKWFLNTILIIGPSEDVSLLYKSLEEYKDEVKAKEKDPGKDLCNICSWIKAKFSDKLPTSFTEEDYELSYSNFIVNYMHSVYDDQAYLAIYSESAWASCMYDLVKLIEVGFPKCIIHYRSEELCTNYYSNTNIS